MVTKHGGGAGRTSGAKRYSQGGRGGHAAAQFAARSGRQRVAVKARVVRARPGGRSAGSLRAHLRYIRGRGEGAEGQGIVFDGNGEVRGEDVLDFAERMDGDRHHFRFIISPEGAERLDLKAFTQELVAHMEQDLGTRLEWVAGEHHDTDNPHVHLMIRGKDERGGDLVINREYISYGMRAQAMEVATRHLGPRLAEEIERSYQLELTANRLTALDARLASDAANRVDGFVTPLQGQGGSLAAERQQVQTLARLQHLESLGLAQERRVGVWQVDPDLVARLRRLGSRNDIVKLMHERMRGETPLSPVIFSKESPPLEPVTGRVVDRGVADELYDRRYLLVDGMDGQAYYVPLSEYSERAGHEATVGSIVTIAPAAKQPARAADRNLAQFAAQHEGVYDPVLHTADAAERLRLPEVVSPADYVESHVKRAKALASRGLIESLPDGRFRIPADLSERVSREVAPGRDSGAVLKVERHSLQDLDAQVGANGVTWLDRELVRGADPEALPKVGAARFERDVQRSLKARAATLRSMGLVEDGPGCRRTQFLDQLYEREIAEAAQRLRGQYGELDRLEAGSRVRGKAVAIEQLPSGPHVVVVKADRFALVPAQGSLAQQVGKTVEIAIGPARTVNALQPAGLQLAVQFRALQMTRSRGLGR
jgi:type IV secretory pathway VirD2 relaxase